MSLFCWNCRGLGNPRAVRSLTELVGLKKPMVVFLSETLLDKNGMEKIRRRLGFPHCFIIPRAGRSGGLAILWLSKVDLTLISYSQNHIDMEVVGIGECKWRFTGFYGYPERHNRRKSWALLRQLALQSSLPWLVCGDFNDLLSQEDKRGGQLQPAWLMTGFQEAIDDCCLMEVQMVGGQFTWRRGTVVEKLDRGLATYAWNAIFPQAKVRLLPALSSDHTPLWITLDGRYNRMTPNRHRFRFEEMWLRDNSCRNVIESCWPLAGNNGDWDSLLQKVRVCATTLNGWNIKHFGHVRRRLKQCIQSIEALAKLPLSDAVLSEKQRLTTELEEWLEREELMWRQRSREIWLQEGDRNTKFFHSRATKRKGRNRVDKLQDNDGVWKHNFEDLRVIATEYFDGLFSSSAPGNIEQVTSCLQPCVSDNDNHFLLRDFSEDELTRALFQMHPSKAPGPDGLSPSFFQHFWSIVKDDVVRPCLQFLNNKGSLPREMNFTHITLIPKCQVPKTMADLRPISLCNVVYRILAKTLANRFKQVLPHVISEEQSAFLPNRLITDNFLIAYEILHYMRGRRNGKIGWQAIKLDMSKAFDRVEWLYVEHVMRALGFAKDWIRLIMSCVSSVTYEVLLNGMEAGKVTPTRGLRQGDPLSPYLFILCAEGLTSMFREAERSKLLHGVRICRQAPQISHLLFADDSFLFLRATTTEACNLMEILRRYGQASGQMVNLQKSSVTFSSNVPARTRRNIALQLGMTVVEHPGAYLGFPAFVGISKTATFSSIKNKFWARINSWREQPLSRAGREVLIKAVLQSLPTYVMGLFLLPVGLCTDLERIMNRYWWGGGEEEHKIHWMEWKKLAISKNEGGLGFRAMHEFNLALLGKQGWRFLSNPGSLAARLMKAKYFPRSDFLHAQLKPACSFVWRSIWHSIDLLKQGCRILIGDGRNTRIWDDPWLPGNFQFYVQSPRPANCGLQYVYDLIDTESQSWKSDLVLGTFNAHEAQLILSLPLSWTWRADCWMWNHTRHGNYAVRSRYHRAMAMYNRPTGPSGSSVQFTGKRLWSLQVPEKIRLMLWSAYRNVLPTKDNLRRKRIDVDLVCPLCGDEAESVLHCFLLCPVARAVWLGSPLGLRVSEFQVECFASFFDSLIDLLGADQLAFCSVICWKLWSWRNNALWNGKPVDPRLIVEQSMAFCVEYTRLLVSRGRGANAIQQRSETKWQPPDEGHVKINVDGALSLQHTVFGMGAIARDHQGDVLAAMVCKGQGDVGAEVAEACSVRRALRWACDLSLRRIILEFDCESIVAVINSDTSTLNSSLGNVLLDCKAMISSFTSCRINHVHRTANAVAHELAKRALMAEEDEFWIEDIPNSIAHLVMGEKSAV